MRITLAAGVAALAVFGLAACNRGSEAARSHASEATSSSGGSSGSSSGDAGYVAARGEGSGGGSGYADRSYRKREPIPDFHGEPLWSDNRQHSAKENARYHCDKSGADIGAKNFDDCVAKVHAFLDHPPSGAKTLTRANGDKLVYDPKANIFAVARKDGAPRTFFKPREGGDYWKKQQAEADDPRGYRSRRSSSGYGGGGNYASGGDRSGD